MLQEMAQIANPTQRSQVELLLRQMGDGDID